MLKTLMLEIGKGILISKPLLNVSSSSLFFGCSVLHKAVGKKDLVTVAFLIRLGADPLLMNNRQHSSVQQLGIKCFPSVPVAANITEKGWAKRTRINGTKRTNGTKN